MLYLYEDPYGGPQSAKESDTAKVFLAATSQPTSAALFKIERVGKFFQIKNVQSGKYFLSEYDSSTGMLKTDVNPDPGKLWLVVPAQWKNKFNLISDSC